MGRAERLELIRREIFYRRLRPAQHVAKVRRTRLRPTRWARRTRPGVLTTTHVARAQAAIFVGLDGCNVGKEAVPAPMLRMRECGNVQFGSLLMAHPFGWGWGKCYPMRRQYVFQLAVRICTRSHAAMPKPSLRDRKTWRLVEHSLRRRPSASAVINRCPIIPPPLGGFAAIRSVIIVLPFRLGLVT